MEIRKLDEVWTSDEQKLGLADLLYHRLDEIDPQLKLYASYLRVESFEFGDEYYVPTDFIVGRDLTSGAITLKVKMIQVLQNTWDRMPDIVAYGPARKEELPPGTEGP